MATETFQDILNGFNLATNGVLVLTSTVAALAIYLILSRCRRDRRWEKYGVKHVDVGLRRLPEPVCRFLMKEHGPTAGYSRDRDSLVLVTSDLNLLKQILIKDFNNFANRNDSLPTKSPFGQGLFFLQDNDWKRIRQLMSPSFSTGKLKRISTHIQDAANRLSQVFQKCADTGANLKLLHTIGQYSTAIIARTAFGLEADSIGEEEDDQFTYYTKTMFKRRSNLYAFLLSIFVGFGEFRTFLIHRVGIHYLDAVTRRSSDYFQAILKESIAEREVVERQSSRHVNNDFLQSLVSTMVASEVAQRPEGEMAPNESDILEKNKVPNSSQKNKVPNPSQKKISKDEIIAQSMLTIFAAYETTSSSLQFCLYMLAKNPDVQEKVYEEILDVVEHEDPTHEDLAKLTYMGQVLDETLRLFPPVSVISRKASETRTYGDITIPAGAVIQIPIKEIQRDPAYYSNPEVFDPERFSPENKATRNPLAFIPFGQGPRLCIGMRLAYLEVKTALVQVLRKVKVELNDTTVPRKGEDITLIYVGTPRIAKPIELAVKLRGD
ncbi:hypothetical protein EGW08_008693 [Elysia chlorotica]|uniref:Cytochrome P450 n=1 Tax=Elysia chlorotica TaxID=188477 RepID=A0A433TPL8_ELYCH|nr:hypothetical protein EGW08_008693 [Elysia chlorotica]